MTWTHRCTRKPKGREKGGAVASKLITTNERAQEGSPAERSTTAVDSSFCVSTTFGLIPFDKPGIKSNGRQFNFKKVEWPCATFLGAAEAAPVRFSLTNYTKHLLMKGSMVMMRLSYTFIVEQWNRDWNCCANAACGGGGPICGTIVERDTALFVSRRRPLPSVVCGLTFSVHCCCCCVPQLGSYLAPGSEIWSGCRLSRAEEHR